MDIGRTSIISKAVSPLKFDSDVKTEKEGQGYKNLGSLFVVLGVLAVFLLLQPFLECRLAFLTVVILSDFRNQMSCKGIDDRLRQINVEFASVRYWAPTSIFSFADFVGAEMRITQPLCKRLRDVLAVFDCKIIIRTSTEPVKASNHY